MIISRLNSTILIEQNTMESDEYGNHYNSWKSYYSCHASISEKEWSAERESAGHTVEHPRIQVTIRYSLLAAKIVPDKYRIRHKGEIYNIIAVDHMYYQNKSLKLICIKERQ